MRVAYQSEAGAFGEEAARPVRLHLAGLTGAPLELVRRVAAHPVALAQCGRALDGLAVLRPDVHDHPDNHTDFVGLVPAPTPARTFP